MSATVRGSSATDSSTPQFSAILLKPDYAPGPPCRTTHGKMNHTHSSSGPGTFTSLPIGGSQHNAGSIRSPDHAAATAAAALTHSHEHTPTANGNSRKRKASSTSVPGSRGVANLTPEQLAKKRANDREAQRAIRQRTKDTIETLANRIKELEGQQPFQELQKVAQERDAALRECEELRKKLATITNVIGSHSSDGRSPPPGQPQLQQQQPNLHGTFDLLDAFVDSSVFTKMGTELAAVTAQQSPLPPLNTTAQQPNTYPPTSAGAQQYEQQQHIHPDLRSPRSATASSPGSVTTGSVYHSDGPGMHGRRWSPGIEHQV
jgi:hypothetical protein